MTGARAGRIAMTAFGVATLALALGAGVTGASEHRAVHALRVDATALTSTSFYIAEVGWRQGTGVETVELPAGTYFLQPNSGAVMGCALTVTGAGAWTYDTACDGFLSGRGSDTLRLIGFDVTLDPSPLTAPIHFGLVHGDWFAGPRTGRVLPTLPGYSYWVAPGSGVNGACLFGVDLDGRITYRDEFEGCLSGRGTRTLTLNGVVVNVDARRLSTKSFTVSMAGLDRQRSDIVQRYRLLPNLLPTTYGGWRTRGEPWPSLGLTVGLDGRVDYPASADGWVSGRDTDTLVIRGYPIEIDATASAPGRFMIPDGNDTDVFDRAGVHTLRLAPVRHTFGSATTEEFRFSVREQDGTIEFGQDPGKCVSGRGTTRLTVGCAAPTPTATPTPTPPPPPPPAERNVTAPQISFEAHFANETSYRCSPGSWEGLGPNPRFDYTWYRQGSITGSLGGVIRETPTVQVATGPTFFLPRAGFGKRYYCVVGVTAASGRRLTAASPTTLLTGRNESIGAVLMTRFYGNFRIRGIDVFQIVQPNADAPMFGYPSGAFASSCGGGTPSAFFTCGSAPADPQRVPYAGVPLDQRKRATAIVYVDMDGVLPSDAGQELEVTLTRPGRPGEITKRIANPETTTTPWVTAAQRADARFGVAFPLPPAWLATAVLSGDPLDLEARVALPLGAGSGALRECPLQFRGSGCAADNRFRLDGVPVHDDLAELTIRTLPLVTAGQTLKPPEEVLKTAAKVFPGGERLTILPYQGALDIDFVRTLRIEDDQCEAHVNPDQTPDDNLRDCLAAHVNLALDDWWRRDAQNRQGYHVLMGVHRYAYKYDDGDPVLEPGWKRGGPSVSTPGQMPTITVTDTPSSPLHGAAHELGHAFGFPHSHTKCGGSTVGQPGESWPWDHEGRLQGTGFDGGYILGRFRYRLLADGATPVYDLMSYCGTRWMSARNWNRAFSVLRALDAARRAPRVLARAAQAGSRAGRALALGVIGPAGARIERVLEADPENLAPTPGSALRVRALDAAGKVLGEAGADVQMLQDAPGTGTFAAAVPAGAHVVELLSGTTTIDRKVRSRAPSIRLRGTRTPRWTARDPDGDPLRVTVEYGADGKTWRTVHQGPSRGRVSIPARFLDAGARARMRVTVDDGFNHARAVTAPFRVAGRPPALRIVMPAAGEAPQAGRVLLQGAALDERGRRLRGRALTWFAGARRLGTGERVMASLPAGRVTLRLEARDAAGRVASARRRLVVAPVALRLQVFEVPDRVSTRASTLPVRLSTSTPATVRMHGRSWDAGPRTRTLRIPLPARPRTGLLDVKLTVTARGARRPALRESIAVLRG